MMNQPFCAALVGNPNAGKSTIFNALTGANQHVGNWPGKTVEKRSGTFRRSGYTFELVDLPGTYSLSAYSPEEMITRDFLLEEGPDVVIIVVDAANLERNLFLAVQVLEMGAPALLALNMMDVAEANDIQIKVELLTQKLGIPVVELVARQGRGLDELTAVMTAVATGSEAVPRA